MTKGKVSIPLTDGMIAAMEHLAQTGDRAFVRLYSQWWVRESEGHGRTSALQEVVDLLGRRKASGSRLTGAGPLVAISTATVKAMARRGILNLIGTKRRVVASAETKDYWRAELTTTGTALRAELEERANGLRGLVEETYDHMTQKTSTSSCSQFWLRAMRISTAHSHPAPESSMR